MRVQQLNRASRQKQIETHQFSCLSAVYVLPSSLQVAELHKSKIHGSQNRNTGTVGDLMQSGRSIVIATQQGDSLPTQFLRGTLMNHKKAKMLAYDYQENQRLDSQRVSGNYCMFQFGAVRLPRRLFRGRLRQYHNNWLLTHSAHSLQVVM